MTHGQVYRYACVKAERALGTGIRVRVRASSKLDPLWIRRPPPAVSRMWLISRCQLPQDSQPYLSSACSSCYLQINFHLPSLPHTYFFTLPSTSVASTPYWKRYDLPFSSIPYLSDLSQASRPTEHETTPNSGSFYVDLHLALVPGLIPPLQYTFPSHVKTTLCSERALIIL